MIVVTMTDVHAARLCARGARVWLAHHGFDVADFIARGLPAETLEATGDHFALKVAATARERSSNGKK